MQSRWVRDAEHIDIAKPTRDFLVPSAFGLWSIMFVLSPYLWWKWSYIRCGFLKPHLWRFGADFAHSLYHLRLKMLTILMGCLGNEYGLKKKKKRQGSKSRLEEREGKNIEQRKVQVLELGLRITILNLNHINTTKYRIKRNL